MHIILQYIEKIKNKSKYEILSITYKNIKYYKKVITKALKKKKFLGSVRNKKIDLYTDKVRLHLDNGKAKEVLPYLRFLIRNKSFIENIDIMKTISRGLRHNELDSEFLSFYEEHEHILYRNYNNLRYFVLLKAEQGEMEYLKEYFKKISTRKFKEDEKQKVYALFRYLRDDKINQEILESIIKRQPGDPAAYIEMAKIYLSRNDYDIAFNFLRKAFELDSEDIFVLEKIVYLKNKISKDLKDNNFFELVKTKLPSNISLYLNAEEAAKNRNYLQAIHYFKELIDLKNKKYYKNSIERLLNLLIRTESYDEYKKYSLFYKSIINNNKKIIFLDIKCNYNQKNYLKVIDLCKKYFLIDNNNEKVFSIFIKSLLNTEQYNETYTFLFESNELFKINEKTLLFLKGMYYYFQLQYDTSEHFFQQSHEIDKSDVEVVRWLIKTYKQNQKENKVLNIFKEYDNYRNSPIHTLNLADSGGLVQYIDKKYYEFKDNMYINNELVEWFVKYQLRHRSIGEAYEFIMEYRKLKPYSEYVDMIKKQIEEDMNLLNIDIHKKYENKTNISDLKSSELVFDYILSNTKQTIYKNKNIPIKRIALVLTSLGPGGAERQCVNLLNGLIQKVKDGEIEDVRLFVTSLTRNERESFYLNEVIDKSKVIEFYDRKNDIDPKTVKTLKSFAPQISLMQPKTRQQTIISLTKHLEEFKPTVIHGWQNEAVLNSFLVGAILDTPSMFGRWGSLPPTISRNLTEIQERNVEYIHKAYKILSKKLKNKIFSANSNVAARAYEEWIGDEDLQVATIYNGLNTDSLYSSIDYKDMKIQYNIPEDSIIVGSIFRVSDEKRPFLWADIAKYVNKIYNKPIYFILIGDGPLLSQLEQYVKENNLSDIIYLVGRKDDVGNWYNIMDVFLLTSAVEGISNAMLEAEYMGVPVVVPDVGGLKEGMIDGKTGYLVKDDSIKNFSNAIIKAIEHRWDESDKKLSKQFIENKFSIPRMVKNTINFYKRNLYDE